jgi:hypothetical protein
VNHCWPIKVGVWKSIADIKKPALAAGFYD